MRLNVTSNWMNNLFNYPQLNKTETIRKSYGWKPLNLTCLLDSKKAYDRWNNGLDKEDSHAPTADVRKGVNHIEWQQIISVDVITDNWCMINSSLPV